MLWINPRVTVSPRQPFVANLKGNDNIWQEISHLSSDRQFVRNTGFVTMISLVLFCSFTLADTSSQRLAQLEKLERLSDLMSVGICIRTQMILRQ